MASEGIGYSEKAQDGAFAADSKEARSSYSDAERGLGDVYVVDKKLERKLLLKFDIHILPMLAIMYLFK